MGWALPDAEATAILRAVMRVEAELLREDADNLPDGAEEQRAQSASGRMHSWFWWAGSRQQRRS